jgi:hypothetical protein
MARERRIAKTFVEIADSLVENFDVIDMLQRLSALRRAARRVGGRDLARGRARRVADNFDLTWLTNEEGRKPPSASNGRSADAPSAGPGHHSHQ